MKKLSDLNVIETIREGDGSSTHPITLDWGKSIKQANTGLFSESSLTRTIMNLFEFLFKQILSQMICLDNQIDDYFNSGE